MSVHLHAQRHHKRNLELCFGGQSRRNTMFGARPCRRVTSDTDIPGAYVFWTIATFSCADRCRRRWTGQGQITEVTNPGTADLSAIDETCAPGPQMARPARFGRGFPDPLPCGRCVQESKTTDRGMGVIYSKSGFSRLLARAHDSAEWIPHSPTSGRPCNCRLCVILCCRANDSGGHKWRLQN